MFVYVCVHECVHVCVRVCIPPVCLCLSLSAPPSLPPLSILLTLNFRAFWGACTSQMLKHGRAGIPMEVMGLMLGEFVDDYTVYVIDVFAMPQSGTVSLLAANPLSISGYAFLPSTTSSFNNPTTQQPNMAFFFFPAPSSFILPLSGFFPCACLGRERGGC